MLQRNANIIFSLSNLSINDKLIMYTYNQIYLEMPFGQHLESQYNNVVGKLKYFLISPEFFATVILLVYILYHVQNYNNKRSPYFNKK